MDITPGQSPILDWELDSSDADFHIFWDESNQDTPTKAEEPDSNAAIQTNLPGLSESTLVLEDINIYLNGNGFGDEMMVYESEEEIKQVQVSNASVKDSRESVLASLEKFVLSFLQQLEAGPSQIELMLVNRLKHHEDGSSTQRVLRWPRRTKKACLRSFACLFRVIDLICESLTANIPTTKRDIFYKDVPLFKNQSIVDELVDDLAATIGVTRADLNVRASSKGLFCGSGIRIHLRSGGVICGDDSEGSMIPAGAEVSRLEMDDSLSWVLIVEKEAVFQTLCRACLGSSSLCPGRGIIITGKGYPDIATREFVGHLSRTLSKSVPILALVDADAYGLDILSVYRFGSQSLNHEGFRITAPRIVWLGVWGSELSSLGIDRDNLIPLTKHDHKKALSMLGRRDAVMPAQWRKEITHMLHARRKAEIEIVSSASIFMPQISASQQSLLQNVFQNDGDTAVAKSPLVQYLIPKLHLWAQAV